MVIEWRRVGWSCQKSSRVRGKNEVLSATRGVSLIEQKECMFLGEKEMCQDIWVETKECTPLCTGHPESRGAKGGELEISNIGKERVCGTTSLRTALRAQ